MRGDLPHSDDERGLERSPRHRAKSGGPSGRTLLIAAILVIGLGYFLVIKLRDMARLQDCAMSGRTNCAPITSTERSGKDK